MEQTQRCFDMSQDINGWQKYDKLWAEFKEKHPEFEQYETKQLRDIMQGFWKYSGEVLTTTAHGIHLKGIGYLSNTIFTNDKKNILKVKWKGGQEAVFQNFRAGGDVYRCYFFPVNKERTPFKGWMFKLSQPLRQKMKEYIQGGEKYKNHIHFLDDNVRHFK